MTECASPSRLALAAAEAEGIALEIHCGSLSGYRGVYRRLSDGRFSAYCVRAGSLVFLGRFGTAVEAALCYARGKRAGALVHAALGPTCTLTAREAVSQASAEGLTFERASSATGFKSVNRVWQKFQVLC